MAHRLFVGLRPPSEIRRLLLAEMHGVERARWQDDAQLHLTLRYIGEVDSRQGDDIVERLEAVRCASFSLTLAGTGFFERKGIAHTLWAGVVPNEPLTRLQHKVERACQAAGCAAETRKFAPHVTLARLNAASGPVTPFLSRTAAMHSPEWPVGEFVLYESHLRSAGSLYEPILRLPLTG